MRRSKNPWVTQRNIFSEKFDLAISCILTNRRTAKWFLPIGCLLALMGGVMAGGVMTRVAAAETQAKDQANFSVLVFSRTTGFRHDSIPAGIRALRELGDQHHFAVDATEDPAVFTDENLKQYQVVIFLNTTGDVLDKGQQYAFQRFMKQGGGYVGVHSASDTEYDWPWYGKLVGAYFASHPRIQRAQLEVLDHQHPATSFLPDRWQRRDEWYNFKQAPVGVRVLLKLDTDSYEGSTLAGNHPAAWYHEYDGGRAFYTAGGHTKESYAEPRFLRHLLGAITWAAGYPVVPSASAGQ